MQTKNSQVGIDAEMMQEVLERERELKEVKQIKPGSSFQGPPSFESLTRQLYPVHTGLSGSMAETISANMAPPAKKESSPDTVTPKPVNYDETVQQGRPMKWYQPYMDFVGDHFRLFIAAGVGIGGYLLYKHLYPESPKRRSRLEGMTTIRRRGRRTYIDRYGKEMDRDWTLDKMRAQREQRSEELGDIAKVTGFDSFENAGKNLLAGFAGGMAGKFIRSKSDYLVGGIPLALYGLAKKNHTLLYAGLGVIASPFITEWITGKPAPKTIAGIDATSQKEKQHALQSQNTSTSALKPAGAETQEPDFHELLKGMNIQSSFTPASSRIRSSEQATQGNANLSSLDEGEGIGSFYSPDESLEGGNSFLDTMDELTERIF